MNAFWNKKKESEQGQEPSSGELTWHPQATQAIEMALSQAPVPGMLKGQIKKQLTKSAESATRNAGRSEVTAEDVMNGMLAAMPDNVRGQVEQAIESKDPSKLQDLQRKLGGK